MIFSSKADHEANLFAHTKLNTLIIDERNNIRAELYSIIYTLQNLENNIDQVITIYTDCHAISSLLCRKEKLQRNKYLSSRTGKLLSNADLYSIFFSLCEVFQPNIVRVKGHTRKHERDFIDTNFSHLDQLVRKLLRRHLNSS